MSELSLNRMLELLDQRQKVKFLNTLRDTVSFGDTSTKVSDFDLIKFVLDCPSDTREIVTKIINEK